jgi:nitrous oxidase accessory protein
MPVAKRLLPLIAAAVAALASPMMPAPDGLALTAAHSGAPVSQPTSVVDPEQPLAAVLDVVPPGGTVVVRGTHRELLVIRKPLTLRCEGATLDGGGRGTVVTVAAADVVIDGCRIRGSGEELVFEHSGIFVRAPRVQIVRNTLEDVLFGIYLKSAPQSVIEDNIIRGWPLELSNRGDSIKLFNSPHSRVRRNRIDGGRDFLIWYSDDVVIEDNVVAHGRYGLHFMNSKDDVLARNRFEDDAIGSYIMYSDRVRLEGNIFARSRAASGFGLAIKDSHAIVAHRNLFVDNSIGIYLDNSPYSDEIWSEFRGNVIAGNGIGLSLLSNIRHTRFGENVFLDNIQQVRVEGGTLDGNDWSPGGRGNFWSDYLGYDVSGDGVGNVPYRAQRYFATLTEEHPEARLLLYSPAVGALEFAARALPVFNPRVMVQDPAPLIHASIPADFVGVTRPSPVFLAAGIALMLLGAVLAGGMRRGLVGRG